ncbi:MAG: hypothetical protein EOM80_04680 [Erysipelotrichia bacterium]|nr:hypothetical protein [Erysipelotrichia bacterium]
MFSISDQESTHYRILIAIPLLLGIIFLYIEPPAIPLADAVPPGAFELILDKSSGNEKIKITEHRKITPAMVVINEATHEELMACPGIGSQTAYNILVERRFGLFFDWRDLKSRVKKMGESKIQTLQDAGVRLSR